MNKIRDSLLAAAGLTVLLVNLTLLTSHSAHSSGPGGPVSVASVYEPALSPVDIELVNDGSYVVPSHKRLVIDFVTARVEVTP